MPRDEEDDKFDAKYGQRDVPFRVIRHSGVVTVAGPELTIEVGNQVYPFEWHSYCGPIPLNKRGDPKELGPKHVFWTAISHWAQQGKRLDENRRAIWEIPAPEDLSDYVRVGRHLMPKEMHARIAAKIAK